MRRAIFGASLLAGAFLLACPPVPVSPINVISNAAACSIDVIEDITIAPTPALLAQTLSDCGILAADLYADISALIAAAQIATDAGTTVTTRKGAIVVSSAYVVHLQQWQALMGDGGGS